MCSLLTSNLPFLKLLVVSFLAVFVLLFFLPILFTGLWGGVLVRTNWDREVRQNHLKWSKRMCIGGVLLFAVILVADLGIRGCGLRVEEAYRWILFIHIPAAVSSIILVLLLRTKLKGTRIPGVHPYIGFSCIVFFAVAIISGFVLFVYLEVPGGGLATDAPRGASVFHFYTKIIELEFSTGS